MLHFSQFIRANPKTGRQGLWHRHYFGKVTQGTEKEEPLGDRSQSKSGVLTWLLSGWFRLAGKFLRSCWLASALSTDWPMEEIIVSLWLDQWCFGNVECSDSAHASWVASVPGAQQGFPPPPPPPHHVTLKERFLGQCHRTSCHTYGDNTYSHQKYGNVRHA